MSELSSTTLLIVLFVLPGYFFCHFLSRYNFPSGRGAPLRITTIIASFFFSLVIFRIFDCPEIKTPFIKMMNPVTTYLQASNADIAKNLEKSSLITDLVDALSFKAGQKEQQQGLDFKITKYEKTDLYILYPATKDSSQNDKQVKEKIVYLTDTIVFYILPFTILLTLLVSRFLKLLEYLIEFPIRNTIFLTAVIFNYVVRIFFAIPSILVRLMFPNLYKKLIKPLRKRLNTTIADPHPLLLLIMFFGALALLFIIFIFFSFMYILSIVAYFINRILYQILSLYKHPAEKLFYNSSLSTRDNTCIVEILDKSQPLLHKGRFCGFDPKNTDQLELLTLDHIIQYRKIKTEEFFHRANRKVNAFVNQESKMTFRMDESININVWFLDHSKFQIDIPVVDDDSLTNYFWYLTLILSFHRASFDLEKLKPQIMVEQIPNFFDKLLNLLNMHYGTFFYMYKKRALFKEMTKLAKQHLRKHREYYRSSDVKIIDEKRAERKLLLRRICLAQRPFKFLKLRLT